MAPQPPPDEPSGIDPLLDRRFARTRHAPGSDARPERPRAVPRKPGGSAAERAGRNHAARGARAVALTASVLATGTIGLVLAHSEGAFGADDGTTEDGLAEPAAAPSETTDPTESAPASTESATAATATTETKTETTTETNAGTSGYADGVYLGTSEYTEWGDVQVEVTITDGLIVDVVAVDYPQSRKSSNINSRALPLLEADAIETQSADVDVVSGATYTSRTYADSLQAALDTAALASSSSEASA